MRLEWKQYGNGTWKLKRYARTNGDLFRWVGKVFVMASGGFMAQAQPQPYSSQYQPFESKEEAMTWVEVIVRMEGK